MYKLYAFQTETVGSILEEWWINSVHQVTKGGKKVNLLSWILSHDFKYFQRG